MTNSDSTKADTLCVAALKLVSLHGNQDTYDAPPIHIVVQTSGINAERITVIISYHKRVCMSVDYSPTRSRRSAIIEMIESRPGLWPHTLAAIERQLISEKLANL